MISHASQKSFNNQHHDQIGKGEVSIDSGLTGKKVIKKHMEMEIFMIMGLGFMTQELVDF